MLAGCQNQETPKVTVSLSSEQETTTSESESTDETSSEVPSSQDESSEENSKEESEETSKDSTETTSEESSEEQSKESSEDSNDDSSESEEDGELTTIILDATNGRITDDGYSSGNKQNTSAKTSKDDSFSFTYTNAMGNASYFAQLKKSSGSISNTIALQGLKTIKVIYECAGTTKPTYSFSKSTNFSSYTELKSGVTYKANGQSFFSIKSGNKVTYIKSIEITFAGETSQETIEWDKDYSTDNVTKDYVVNENTDITDVDICTPSIGTQNVLVLPIEFSDNKFTSDEIKDIKTLTNGTPEETNYWESLSSYYSKSSYGKLDLEFTYADPYNVGVTAQKFYSTATNNTDRTNYVYGSAKAMRDAIASFKSKNGDDATKKFDADSDGYIDTVIMIYSESQCPSYDEDGDLYWAFRYYDLWNEDMTESNVIPEGNEESPVGFSYFWASMDFAYSAVEQGEGVDAHTLIHEFGHILGADDYYNTTANSTGKTGYEPTGGNIMMAYNILDHDAFNKLQYSWVTPSYVTGSCEVTISSFEKSGDCILIADEDGWNGTAFDEYILLELYTPTGLNELDSKDYYDGTVAKGQDEPGIRMWHVDNRLYKYDSDGYEDGWASDEEIRTGNYGNDYLTLAISNGSTNYYSEVKNKDYNALTLISPKGTKYTSKSLSTNEDLFHKGDKFSLIDDSLASLYAPYFGGESNFDNGNDFDYEIEVTSLSSESATVRFTKRKN